MTVATSVDATTLVGGPVRIRVLRSEVIRTGVSRSTNRPYTLYSLTATLTNVPATPIVGDLRTFDSFDGAEYSVTIAPDAFQTLMVKKVRDAADIRASRNKARAQVVGETPTPVGRPPTRTEVDALAERVTQLEIRLELALSLYKPPEADA